MDPAAPATRMTSSFTINISTPSFYNPPKKFAPVVPPKPKVNPFKASEESLVPQEISGGPGVHRGFVGKVGEIPLAAPPTGDQEDFVLPPPPPREDFTEPSGACFPPPPPSFGDEGTPGSPTGSFPPPPPPEFAEPFLPSVEESFPSPPPPEETAALTDHQVTSLVVPPPPPLPQVASKPLPPPGPLPKPQVSSEYVQKPLAVASKATAPSFAPGPTIPSAIAPKTTVPPVVSSKPLAPPTSTPHAFPPKPVVPPTCSPKPVSFQTFTPKPLNSSSTPPKSIEPTTAVSRPPERFPPSHLTSKLTPGGGEEAVPHIAAPGAKNPGFNMVQQREKPRVLEKVRPNADGSNIESDRGGRLPGEIKRSHGAQAEREGNDGTQSNGKPLPEGLRSQKPSPDPVPQTGPQSRMQRPAESESSTGSLGLNMKEVEELEMLTQQLMREMDKPPAAGAQTVDLCGFCGRGLSRTETVVRAGEHLYHVACFTCFKCDQQLQGQQYYESGGRPLCEECYQDTLECCALCQKKITERLLKAIGKCYHPACFTCAVCQCSLQGEPFIVDDASQPHCVADYHRRYAPRCSVCGDPIAPEQGRDETVRVVALEKNFHMMCYKCEDCGCPLSIEADDSGCFPLDGHVLCKKCHTVRARAALS
ncbi:hypothetical protein GDO86_019248 [Hymenochirus boettgeri]|uniref:Zyxin n=1 Tax=Hymenochirus boettgeri TaxID=247094 RepID=A0A8T2IHZ2_9PIPI|nr:hypothetical protein GDO86_019248 [Hymenochirus boettgeri]KAG8429776.1 hypothetical protein GDO86_019248 [Hymenochirus boettgeri]